MPREQNLELGIRWLLKSIDTKTNGSRANYSWFWNGFKGWAGPYPETSGYIIPTFIDLSRLEGWNLLTEKAIMMGDWLLTLQFGDGAFPGGIHSNKISDKSIFNTGQIILGLTELYKETGFQKYLDSSEKAAKWLVSELNEEGNWPRFNYVKGYSPSYYTRVTWPILKVGQMARNEDLLNVSEKAIDFILTRKRQNGFIAGCGFTEEGPSVLHTLAYTIRGLLESSAILENIKYYEAAEDFSYRVLRKFEINKRFYGAYDEKFKGVNWYQCLTGNVQMAIIWLKVYLRNGDPRFLNAAIKAIDSVAERQVIKHLNKNLVGAIPGSSPVYGRYMMFRYPNWAVKFFIDAILLEEKVLNSLKKSTIIHESGGPVRV